MGVNIRVDAIKTFSDVRDALQKIKESLDGSVLAKGEWSFFEITLTAAVSEFTYTHNLMFTPTDVIQVAVTEGVTVTWHYQSFNRVNIVLSTTGACVVRAYIGRHREGSI